MKKEQADRNRATAQRVETGAFTLLSPQLSLYLITMFHVHVVLHRDWQAYVERLGKAQLLPGVKEGMK